MNGTIRLTFYHSDEPAPKGMRPIHFRKGKMKPPTPKLVKELSAVEWLKLACATDYKLTKTGVLKEEPRRPMLTAPYYDATNEKTVASDGFRMHLIATRVDNLPKPIGMTAEELVFPDYSRVIPEPREDDAVGTFDRDAVIHALLAVKPFAELEVGTVKISLNGSMQVSAISEEGGDCTVEIEGRYSHDGANILTGVHYQKMLDALAGMPKVVNYRVHPSGGTYNTYPITLSGTLGGEKRMSVLMPMMLQ